MIIKDLVQEGIKILRDSNIEKADFEARILLTVALNKDISYLYAYYDENVSLEQCEKYFQLISKRAKKIPLQYIIGIQEFMSLDFDVNNSVLIPRADTEILVEYVIELYKSKDKDTKWHILDLGTGSGCIAISLAYYIKCSDVLAIDVSDAALETAAKNAVKNKVSDKIKFLKSDLFENLSGYENFFDVIVSNPPYIARGELTFLQEEVRRYEPVIALEAGEDGLFFYRKILKNAGKYLKRDGFLIFEIGYKQANDLREIALEYGYMYLKTKKDLANNDRVVVMKNI